MDHLIFWLLIFSLFSIGVYCTTKKNFIRTLLGIEIVLNSGNLAFIYFSSAHSNMIHPLGQSLVFMSMILGGSVVAVGLSMAVNAYKQFRTLDVRKLRRLRW